MRRNIFNFEVAKNSANAPRHSYQNATSEWAMERLLNSEQKGVLLCDPVGNGKTWEAILILLNYAASVRGVRRVLIVGGKKELCNKWINEICGRDQAAIYQGFAKRAGRKLPFILNRPLQVDLQRADSSIVALHQNERVSLRNEVRSHVIKVDSLKKAEFLGKVTPNGIWVVTYYVLNYLRTSGLIKQIPFDFVIFDECHHARKRTRTATYNSLIEIQRETPWTKVVGLTATPAGATQQDTVNLIETVCFKPAESGEETAPQTSAELRSLWHDLSVWFNPVEEHPKNLRGTLESGLSKYICRTPNQRSRSYSFTGELVHPISGVSNLPIPCPFGTQADGVRSIRSDEPILFHDLVYLTALQASLGAERKLNEEDKKACITYTFLTAGDEAIQKLLEGTKHQRSISRNIKKHWFEKKEVHPKTARLLKFAESHFDPSHWDSHGKLLVFCSVKSVVTAKPLRVAAGCRSIIRSAFATQLEKYYRQRYKGRKVGELPKLLGNAKSARFTRRLKTFLSSQPGFISQNSFVSEEYSKALVSLIKRTSPTRVYDLLHGEHGIGFNEGMLGHLDGLRDSLICEVFAWKNGEINADREMKYIQFVYDFLKKYHTEAFGDTWFGLGNIDIETAPKLTRGKGPFQALRGLFFDNHGLIFEAQRLCKRDASKLSSQHSFLENIWKLACGVRDTLSAQKFKLNPRSEGRDNPLTHPMDPLLTVTGDLNAGSERTKVIQLFNLPVNPTVLVCTNVGTEGIDLHGQCWDVVLYTLDWVPSEIEQKIGRIDRERLLNGSLREVYKGDPRYFSKKRDHIRVHFAILPHTYDERILARVNRRASEDRSIFVKGDESGKFADSVGEKRESLDLRPAKNLRRYQTRKSKRAA